MTVATFIRKAPIKKKEIAKAAGVDISSVFRWQREACHPEGLALQQVVKLARKLGMTIRPEDIEAGIRRCKGLQLQKSA